MYSRIFRYVLIILVTVAFTQEYQKDRVNVKFKDTPSRQQVTEISEEFKLEVFSRIPELNVVAFRITSGESVKDLIEKLQANSLVEYAEPEYIYQLDKTASVKSEKSESDSLTGIKPFYRGGAVEYKEGEVLVKFRDTERIEQINVMAERMGLQITAHIRQIGMQCCRITTETEVEEMLNTLRQNPDVEYAEPNYIYHALEIPNDPQFSRLWGLNNEGQTGGTFDADMDAPEAWEKEKGNKSVIVSIIDTGIDYTHPDLAANIWINSDEIAGNGIDDDNNGYIDDTRGWDFVNGDNNPMDDNDHGSHCAGTVGAVGNNSNGIVGVNWAVSLMPLKFLNASGSGSSSEAINAIIYAVNNGSQILSNSWGGGGESQALKDAIEYARQNGVLFIAAAGNESNDNDVKPHYPSNYEVANVLSVAATDDRDLLASFSNYGPQTVDLSAPGVEIYSTIPGNRYNDFSGTSMATPHVAGAAALLWARYSPAADWQMVKYRLFGGVDFVRNLENYVLLDGRLNVNNAMAAVPVISVIEKPMDTNNETGPYPVGVAIVAEDSLVSAKLFFRVNNGSSLNDTLNLIRVEKLVYQAEIPGAVKGSKIEYKIRAEDNGGQVTETRYYSFEIGSAGSGCCGAGAATYQCENELSTAGFTVLLNILIFLGPPAILRKRLQNRK